MRRFIIKYFILAFPVIFSGSCTLLVPNKLFKTPRNYEFAPLTDTFPSEFSIRPGDKFELFVFSNGGEKLFDPIITDVNRSTFTSIGTSLQYEVGMNGDVELPKIGTINLLGFTEKYAADTLEILYKQYYINPFVRLIVNNRNVTVFRGNTDAKVVVLANQYTTIMEVLAQAGGIPPTGKTKTIKLIRTVNGRQSISRIDLSGSDNLYMSNIYVKPDDIIYIEPSLNTDFFKEISPVVSIASGILIIYTFFATVGKL